MRVPAMNKHLLPEEKLEILQAVDPRRKWYSLDDQRVCVLCERAISGRQIAITRDASGAYAAHCPTEGCASVPGDWFYYGSTFAGAKAPARRAGEINFFGQ